MSTGTQGLPAYSITEVEVIDEDGFKRYRELAQAAVTHYGGRFLVQGAKPIVAPRSGFPTGSVAQITQPGSLTNKNV
jgi:uncharacterized protein (DUF1330 family)